MNKSVIMISLKLIFLLMFLSVACFAQKKTIEANKTLNCELTSFLFGEFAQGIDTDKTIVIISYQGKTELNKEMAARRLYNIRVYLTEFYKNTIYYRPPDKVISGIATDKTDQGRLDFYVDGKLSLTALFINNRDLILSPCSSDKPVCQDKMAKMYFPCVGKANRRGRN